MHVIGRVEIRALSALRDPLLDSRRTFWFPSSTIVTACVDLTRGGPARQPT